MDHKGNPQIRASATPFPTRNRLNPHKFSTIVELIPPLTKRNEDIPIKVTYTNMGDQNIELNFQDYCFQYSLSQDIILFFTQKNESEPIMFGSFSKKPVFGKALTLHPGESYVFETAVSWCNWYDGMGYTNHSYSWLTIDMEDAILDFSLICPAPSSEQHNHCQHRIRVHPQPDPILPDEARQLVLTAWEQEINQSEYFQPDLKEEILFNHYRKK
jgi:hypothetical protein